MRCVNLLHEIYTPDAVADMILVKRGKRRMQARTVEYRPITSFTTTATVGGRGAGHRPSAAPSAVEALLNASAPPLPPPPSLYWI